MINILRSRFLGADTQLGSLDRIAPIGYVLPSYDLKMGALSQLTVMDLQELAGKKGEIETNMERKKGIVN